MKYPKKHRSSQPFLPIILPIWLILALITFIACSREEEPSPPVISAFELGYQNNHTAYAGSDLHIEAEILAEGKIQYIILEIHPEGTHEEDQASGLSGNPWEIDTTYTGKYSGVKNTTFHEHLDIPATADTGYYHVHFIISDIAGNQTSLEEELYILLPADTTSPVIQVFSHPQTGQSFSTGDPMNLPFTASLVVGAPFDNDHPDPKPIVWTAGNFYLLIKSPDVFGGNVAFSEHYPIIID